MRASQPSHARGHGLRRPLPDRARPVGSVIDLYCGAGGLSYGFLKEGFSIECGYDTDEACRYPFEKNNGAPFVRKDVTDLRGSDLNREFSRGLPRILIGCAPCQPFSTYTQAWNDPKWELLNEFSRLIRESKPDIVSMENVPRMVKFKDGAVFDSFVRKLKRNGYQVAWDVVYCPDFGVPQSRSRLVLIASRYGQPKMPAVTRKPENYRTVWESIGSMPPLAAGESDSQDRLHRASRLSDRNLARIRASTPGGTWRDWSGHLVTNCHKKRSGKNYSSVYGRMDWDQPSPTMTTQFYGFGNGRFGHPEQDRGISIREGALLQTFPKRYAFVAADQPVHLTSVGRMIGNAVPVNLARAIARSIKRHLEDCG